MSAKVHQTVLRIPCTKCGIDDPWEFAANNKGHFAGEIPGWAIAPTAEPNIDYVLYEEICPHMDAGGRCRDIDPSEQIRYRQLFEELLPAADMNDVKLVDYCWYDSMEAPDYYVTCEGGMSAKEKSDGREDIQR